MKQSKIGKIVKRSVICFADYYLPAFRAGGTVTALSRLVGIIEDFRIFILTRNTDLKTKSELDVVKREWGDFGGARVAYLPSTLASLVFSARECHRIQPSLYFFGSAHSARFTILPVLGIRLKVLPAAPILIAPNGEFGAAALRHKGWKKALARPFMTWLLAGAVWKAASDAERTQIFEWLGRRATDKKIIVIPDVPPRGNKPLGDWTSPNPEQKSDFVRIVQTGRIQTRKGLHLTIEALSQCRGALRLTVYGPVEDEAYFSRCLELAEKLPENVEFSYGGEYVPSELSHIYENADLGFFPSLGEGFGHGIAEALSFGCPVVTTTKSPWIDFLGTKIGCVSDEISDWVRYVDDMSRQTLDFREKNKRELIISYDEWADSCSHLSKNLFFDAIALSDKDGLRL